MSEQSDKTSSSNEKQNKPHVLEAHFCDWDKTDKAKADQFASEIDRLLDDNLIPISQKGYGTEMRVAEVEGIPEFQNGWEESKLMRGIKKSIEKLGPVEVRFSSTESETKKPDTMWLIHFEMEKKDNNKGILNIYIKWIKPRGPKNTIEKVIRRIRGLKRLLPSGTIED